MTDRNLVFNDFSVTSLTVLTASHIFSCLPQVLSSQSPQSLLRTAVLLVLLAVTMQLGSYSKDLPS